MGARVRFRLTLTYVFSRDRELGVWVGWCPEVDTMSQGHDLNSAIWMLRSAVRMTVEHEVTQNRHPLRWRVTASEDEDWALYQEYLRSQSAEDYNFWHHWDHVYDGNKIPERVDHAFMTTYMTVSTFAGAAIVDESDCSGQISYKRGKRVRCRLLIETDYDMDLDRLDGQVTLESVRAVYGQEVKEIISQTEIEL